MMKKRLKAIVFDLDDTLIDWSRQEIGWNEFLQPGSQSMCDVLAELGYAAPDPQTFHTVFRRILEAAWDAARTSWNGISFYRTLAQTCNEFDIVLSAEELCQVAHSFVWNPVPGVAPFDDTIDVLIELQATGYKLGLITNSFQPMWMRDVELKQFGLIDFFPKRITSGDTGFIKPHPAIYWRMLGMLDIMPDEALFVGDHPTFDIQGANLVGMTSVLFKPPYLDRPINGHEPDYTIGTLSDLLPILEQL